MAAVKVGLAQINLTVGDLTANASKVLDAAHWAAQNGVDILLLPEQTLTGYPAEDLLLRSSFIAQQEQVLRQLMSDLVRYPDLHVVVGHVRHSRGALYNAASVLLNGRIVVTHDKHELPVYGVFNERRYFSSGRDCAVFQVEGLGFGLAICEDAWLPGVPATTAENGAQVLLMLNASPYSVDKQAERIARIAPNIKGMAGVYLNKTGGQDELVFDGASFVMDADGQIVTRLPVFQEARAVVEFDTQARPRFAQPVAQTAWPERTEQIWQALTLALRDYMGKSGFSDALVGLSGGIDSAVVLALAVDAVGAEHVRAVMMPSSYTASISTDDASAMARGLGVAHEVIAISALAGAYDAALAESFKGLAPDISEENIQARIRGNLLMALSNKFGSLVLVTGNKSEVATGYSTLYGDMAGGFAVLKDIPKTWVYELARWRNSQSFIIPQRIIDRPPSAELRPEQTDQDSLPPYEILDAIIERYVEKNESVATLEQAGFDPVVVADVVRLIRLAEYKRRQGAVGPKITSRAFGSDWRFPITNGFRE